MAVRAVAVAGALFAAASLAVFGPRAALSVAAGGALATANLLALARVVGAILPESAEGARAQSRGSWVLLAGLKLVGLFVVLWLLLRYAGLSPLAVAAGFGALPIGIAIGSLVSDRNPA
jgi:hypothetical protein